MADPRLEQLAQTVRDSNSTITQLQTTINSLQSELIGLKGALSKDNEVARMRHKDLQKQIEETNRWNDMVRSLNEIPGIRTPRWYEVDVEFNAGDNSLKFDSTEISPDGPFIITQMQCYYTYSEAGDSAIVGSDAGASVLGRTVPCTAYPFLVGNAGGLAASTSMLGNLLSSASGTGPLSAIPEFSFQIEIAGSGRFWTNRSLPAATFYGEVSPLYSGIAGWVERTDRIVLHCSPEISVPVGGKVRMVFHGYQILGHINIGEALGY